VKKYLEDYPTPEIAAATDAMVRIAKTAIRDTNLHILEGDAI
jgi:alcohol dehydrogenase